jgi:hypothetical protein
VLTAITATVLGTWLLGAVPSVPTPVVVAALGVLLLAVGYVLAKRRRTRVALVAVAVLLVAGTCVHALLSRPSEEERRVAAYLEGICSENMWLDDSAVCYAESGDYIVDHFDAFDPDEWHGWTELSDAQAIGAQRLTPDAPGIAGEPIFVAGRVLDYQQLGGLQQVIQVRPMTTEESARFLASDDVAKLVPDEAERATLAGTSLSSDIDYHELIYCNLPARPFFLPQSGEILLFKGTLIASGRTGFATGPQAGKQANLTYVTCSTAERVQLAAA